MDSIGNFREENQYLFQFSFIFRLSLGDLKDMELLVQLLIMAFKTYES